MYRSIRRSRLKLARRRLIVETLENRLVMHGDVRLQLDDTELTFTMTGASEDSGEIAPTVIELGTEESTHVLECGILSDLSLDSNETGNSSSNGETDAEGEGNLVDLTESEEFETTTEDDGAASTECGTDVIVLAKSDEADDADGAANSSDENGGITLQQLGKAEEVSTMLLTEAAERYGSWFGQPVWTGVWDYALLENSGNSPVVFATTDRSVSTSTNVQVDGVDEGDLVETDGDFIYVARDEELVIVDVRDPTEHPVVFVHRVAQESEISAHVQALLLHENRITIVSSIFRGPNFQHDAVSSRLWQPSSYSPRTLVTVLDVSDPTHPVLVDQVELDGTFSTSRAIGSDVYLILSNGVDFPVPQTVCEPNKPDESNSAGENDRRQTAFPAFDVGILPWPGGDRLASCHYESRDSYVARVRDTIAETVLPQMTHDDQTRYLTEPEAIYWDLRHDVGQLLSIVRIDASSNDASPEATTTLELNGGNQIYVSAENVYIFSPIYSDAGTSTTITKFALSDGEAPIELVAQGNVPGMLLNQFSADEHAGALRVATTTWQFDSVNGVYVLQQDGDALEVVGKIEGIAPGERIYSARFIGDVGYLVTFRQIDPLFSLDLSDPTNPQVTGELKIPGFSNYLHPVAGNKLVGIGQDAGAWGNWGQSLLVSLFDVADPAAPASIDRFTYEGHSNGFYDHHAINYYDDAQILAIPVTNFNHFFPEVARCLFADSLGDCHFQPEPPRESHALLLLKIDPSLGEEGIQLLASVGSHSPIARSIKIDDRIFAIGIHDIYSIDLNDPSAPPIRSIIGGIANPDWYRFERSETPRPLNVLENDFVRFQGGLENWKIVETTRPSGGGTVAIAEDGHSLLYTTPADRAVTYDDFEYVIENARGQEHRARVSIGIHDRRIEVPDDRKEVGDRMAERAKKELAEKLKTDVKNIQVLGVRFVEWPDSCLGVPGRDVCLTVVTPGFVVILDHEGQRYEYHTDSAETVVLIERQEANPGPIDDEFRVEINSRENHFDVLANDFPGVNFIRAPVITAVSEPEHGGKVTIASNGFSLIYTPTEDFQGTDTFTYTVDGNATASVRVNVESISDVVEIRLEASDLDGNPISAVTVGETFVLEIYVKDLRALDPEVKGIFAAYMDLTFNDRLARVGAETIFGDAFPNGQKGDFTIPGLIDDLGAFTDEIRTGKTGEVLLARVEFTATNPGVLEFDTANAGATPVTDILVFGEDRSVEVGAINFTGIDIQVVEGYYNATNSVDINGDRHASPIDALILVDDINKHGARKITHVLKDGEGEARGRRWFYFDPNRDGYISPVDVVLVINSLNQLAIEFSERPISEPTSTQPSSDAVTPDLSTPSDNDVRGGSGGQSPDGNNSTGTNNTPARPIEPLSPDTVQRIFGRLGRRPVNSILDDLEDVARDTEGDPQQFLDEIFSRIGRRR